MFFRLSLQIKQVELYILCKFVRKQVIAAILSYNTGLYPNRFLISGRFSQKSVKTVHFIKKIKKSNKKYLQRGQSPHKLMIVSESIQSAVFNDI